MNALAEPKPARSLSALHEEKLAPAYQAIFDQVAPGAAGPEPWRRFKLSAAHSLLAATQVSGRMAIQYLDLADALRAVFLLRVPVPCRRGGEGPLRIEPAAQLALTYRREAMITPQPGYSFFEVLAPRDVYHPNIAPSYLPPGAQILCLGPVFAPATRVVDLVVLAYTALCFQSVQFSLVDSAGLLNPASALWLQASGAPIPLTKEPFLPREEKTA